VTTDELKSFYVTAEGADSVKIFVNGVSVEEMTEATVDSKYVFAAQSSLVVWR